MVSALPVFFRTHCLYLNGVHSAGGFYFLFQKLFCPACERNGDDRVSNFTRADGAAAIFPVLFDGDAGVLDFGNLDVHLHPVRV